jgi:Uma2 family endonuclease
MSVTLVKSSVAPAPQDEGVRPRRWTRKEYYRAAELGLFRPGERLELLDGEIIDKMTQKPPHAVAVGQASDILAGAFGPTHHVRSQQPLILTPESEPEPDVVVVPGTRSDYLASHPRAVDARLVIEVSDTTLGFDRGRKRTAYARAGIPEYWIVNLVGRQVEVCRDPRGARYRSVTVYDEQQGITPLAAPEASVRAADLLPPQPAPENA